MNAGTPKGKKDNRALPNSNELLHRQSAKEALRASEEHLRLLLETTNAIPWEANANTWRFTYVGPQAVKLLGYSTDQWYEKDFWATHIHPKDREFAIGFCEKSSRTSQDYEFEYRMIAADGRAVWLHDIVNVQSFNGAPVTLRGFMLDITERKQAQAKFENALSQVARLKDQLQAENIYLREEIDLDHHFGEIIGQNEDLKKVLLKVQQVAATDATVLILGETGTGKELLARAIHRLSQRKDRSLVKLSCATLPSSLIENELFGHAKGAFTGAVSKQVGRFELANGATIFLDEIGDLPLNLQAKLLRVLQEGEFERLGDPHTFKVDARIIVATNHDLEEAVRNGGFRADLYHRLNVFPLALPPLRERRDDIPMLVQSFVNRHAKKLGKTIDIIPQPTMTMLQEYSWPGNIRELENVIERAVIVTPGATLRMEDVFDLGQTAAGGQTLEDIEREHINQILQQTRWRIEGRSGAATVLGLKPATLRSRMQKLGIHRPH